MTRNSKCAVTASREGGPDHQRLKIYKMFAAAFSYPDEKFFLIFQGMKGERDSLTSEYDQLFRCGRVWLYGAEQTAENEFQRVNCLSDITGFYRAFGLETNGDRPDSLPAELEFMHYLIFKQIKAPDKEKASICYSAQKKFFDNHLYPAAKKTAESIILKTESSFYKEISGETLLFLEKEKKFFGSVKA